MERWGDGKAASTLIDETQLDRWNEISSVLIGDKAWVHRGQGQSAAQI
jgi:hypothetical protein